MEVDVIVIYGGWFIGLAALFGLYMTWGIGANDVANAMGTSVGSGAITVKQAILIAAVFEFAGVILAGGQVTETVRKGIVDLDPFIEDPELLIYGMLSSLLAAGVWLMIASAKGWPVSTTHSIIGALVGFALVGIGQDAVQWTKVMQIVVSWIVSPLVGGSIAYLIMISIRHLILDTDNPFDNAKKWGPVYVFFVGFLISLVTLFKGLKHLDIEISTPMSFVWSAVIGFAVAFLGWLLIRNKERVLETDKKSAFPGVERVFAPMQVFTACAMAFAHGSNDVANGIGPLSAVVSIVQSGGEVAQTAGLPLWILVLGGIGIVVGLSTMGYRVMKTIGKKINDR